MKLVAIPLAPLLAILLSGCTRMTAHEGGTTLVGAFTAAGLGSVAARAMDKTDRSLAARALETVPSGQSANWRNRETGDSFVLTPTRAFNQLGATCREFTVRVEAGGHADTAFGRACRKNDGSWHMSG